MHWLHLISKLSDLFLQIYNTLILNQTRHSQVWFSWLPVLEGCIQKYNPPKQYWQAGPIILYEWCYVESWYLRQVAANMSPVNLSRVACAAVPLLAIVRRWLMMLTIHGTLCSPDTILHTPHLGRGEHELQTFVQTTRYSAILQLMNRGNQREWRGGDWVFWRTAVLDT